MSAGQRWNLAAELTKIGAELQQQASSRTSRNLSDPAVVEALELMGQAQETLGRAVAALTTADEHEDQDGDAGP